MKVQLDVGCVNDGTTVDVSCAKDGTLDVGFAICTKFVGCVNNGISVVLWLDTADPLMAHKYI